MSFDYHSYQSDITLIVNHAELVRKAMEMGYPRPIHARNDVLTEEQLVGLRESGRCAVVIMFDPENEDVGARVLQQLDQCGIPRALYDISFSIEGDPASLDEALQEFPTIERLSDTLIDRGVLKDRNYTDRCGNCHSRLKPGDKYCRICGAERGEGAFEPFLNRMDVVYGPPIKKQYQCQTCGYKWVTVCLGGEDSYYCPSCGENTPKLMDEIVGSISESFDDEELTTKKMTRIGKKLLAAITKKKNRK